MSFILFYLYHFSDVKHVNFGFGLLENKPWQIENNLGSNKRVCNESNTLHLISYY